MERGKDLYAVQVVLKEFADSATQAQKKFDEMILEGLVPNGGEVVKVATRKEVEDACELLLMLRRELNKGKPMDRRKEVESVKEHFISGFCRDFGPWLEYFYDAANEMTQAS
jgi:hypothetical protein